MIFSGRDDAFAEITHSQKNEKTIFDDNKSNGTMMMMTNGRYFAHFDVQKIHTVCQCPA